MHPVDFDPVLERALAHARDYLSSLPERPVAARAGAEAILAALDRPMPEAPLDPIAVVDELVGAVDPGLTAMPSGRFFGWVIGGALPAALAADWLTSAWDQNAGSATGTPAAAAVERVVIRWILELLDLPRGASGGLVTGAQMANFVGLVTARDHLLRAGGWDVGLEGLAGAPPLRVVVGEERHNTVDKALRLLGFGARQLTLVPVDGAGRMRSDALARELAAIEVPAIVCAQVGHVSGGAVDPLLPIADAVDALRRRRGPQAAWLHVDGAFGLWARASGRHRALADGAERADSWATDAHKWLNTPYDCGIALTAHPEAHRRALGTQASYLPPSSGVENPYDFTPELSRRARGFSVYAALRQLGRSGVAELVDRGCALAARLAALLSDLPGVELLAGPGLNQLVVALRDPAGVDDDAHTRRVLRDVVDEGVCYPTPSVWRGRAAIRFSISNFRTDEADLAASVAALARAHRG